MEIKVTPTATYLYSLGIAQGILKIRMDGLYDNPSIQEIIPPKPLYFFEYDFWLDDEGIITIIMWGSIISMMQYKKYIQLNYPNAILKEDV